MGKQKIIKNRQRSEGEAKTEDEKYGKPNLQCQKHQKVITDETKTKERKIKTRDMKHQQKKKKIKTTKIPAKQMNQKQNISNYTREC